MSQTLVCESDVPFVGRRNELLVIGQEYLSHKIFGIFGLRSIGKSTFVHKFLETKANKSVYANLKHICDVDTLYTNLCACLLIEPERSATLSPKWITNITTCINYISKSTVCHVFFDNTEDSVENNVRTGFLTLCSAIVKNCPNVKMFVTSTTRIGFANLGRVFFALELKTLSASDSRNLLRITAPSIAFGDIIEDIAALSEGLPLLILMIGAELNQDEAFITPTQMVELLLTTRLKTLSGTTYPPEERVELVYSQFIHRLSHVYLEFLSTLDYIPGSFDASQAHEILLCSKTEAHTKIDVLRPIRIKSMLTYDATTGRFDIQGILREVIKAGKHLTNIPEIRARYVKIYSKVLTNIAQKIGTVEYTKALSEFATEQPNLRKLLMEVHHTTQDTYHFFVEIATNCNQMIEIYMAGESDDFYEQCLQLAQRYKRPKDKAGIHLAVGSMCTNTKGNFTKGYENYHSAMKYLEQGGKSLQLATVYQRIGWNLHRQGRNEQAVMFYKKSLEISMISEKARGEFWSLAMQSFSSIGIAYTWLGNLDIAEKYHKACLKHRRQKLGEEHPFVGATYNNLGLLYEQTGEADSALESLSKGLEIKRKANAPKMSIISSLNTVANANNALSHYNTAHALLDEAMKIIGNEKLPMQDAESLTLNTRGKIYAKQGKLVESRNAYKASVQISDNIASFQLMKRLVNLAGVQEQLGERQECLKTLHRAIRLKELAIQYLAHNFIVTECQQCMMRIFKEIGEPDKYKTMLYDIEGECFRLDMVLRGQHNQEKIDKNLSTLMDVQTRLNNISSI